MADKRSRIGARLQHVYWIGGSPCCGKSSIARILDERHCLHLHTCDDAFLRHARRADHSLPRLKVWRIHLASSQPVGLG